MYKIFSPFIRGVIFFTNSFSTNLPIMSKELYLYSPIYNFVAQDLISAMEDTNEDIVMRVNSPGGDVFAGWGIAAKMIEHTGKITIKVDGAAMSMGAALLVFADKVEALDVSTIMLHRASMYISKPEDQVFLDKVNAGLRAKLETKIDGKKLKELKGVSIKNLFEDETRLDLFLSAKEAKQIGLVDKINVLTPNELTAFNNKMFAVAAEHTPENPLPTQKNNKMTLEKLKAEHPELYNQIFALGVAQEKDRVEACLVFNEIDPVAVKAAIEGGKPLTQKQMSEFSLKALSGKTLASVQADSAKPLTTAEVEGKEKTDKEKQLSDFEAIAKKDLGVK